MKQPETLKKVSEFYNLFDLPIMETPCIPGKKQSDLRITLLQEELNELKEAINNKDIVEIADALGDIEYVLVGTILEFGLGNQFKKAFDKIHKSNMSKVCNSLKEAKETIQYYKEKEIEVKYVKKNDKYLVYRVSDKKILKSINYKPVDLKFVSCID